MYTCMYFLIIAHQVFIFVKFKANTLVGSIWPCSTHAHNVKFANWIICPCTNMYIKNITTSVFLSQCSWFLYHVKGFSKKNYVMIALWVRIFPSCIYILVTRGVTICYMYERLRVEWSPHKWIKFYNCLMIFATRYR